MAFDVTSYLLGRNSSGGGGGGNPNRVEVFHGTMQFPLNDLVKEKQLYDGIRDGSATATVKYDFSVLGVEAEIPILTLTQSFPETFYGQYRFACYFESNADMNAVLMALGIAYNYGPLANDVYEDQRFYFSGGTACLHNEYVNISSYASIIPCVLTIYWHPMPTIPE